MDPLRLMQSLVSRLLREECCAWREIAKIMQETQGKRRFNADSRFATHIASWTAKRQGVAVWSGQSYNE